MESSHVTCSEVDSLIEATSAEQVLTHFGLEPPSRTTGEHRLPCVFNSTCADSSYGSLTINLSDSAKRSYCHSCGTRGNLLTLIHGLQHHRAPSGGRLRGDEFKDAVATLRAITGDMPVAGMRRPHSPTPTSSVHEPAPKSNIPLRDSDNARARELANLHECAVVNADEMPSAAAQYFAEREYLTSEVCAKWLVGYLPSEEKGTLAGRVIYGIESVSGDVLAWSGRDPDYDANHARWIKSGRPKKGEPIKHRFPSHKMFRKGLELYGQQRSRLDEPGCREAIAEIGLVIVEGMNDVILLDCLKQPSFAVMSNRMTDCQVDKVCQWARQLAGGKVVLMFDNDQPGQEGAKETLWKLHQQDDINPRLAWSDSMFDGEFAGRQPESLSPEEWNLIRQRLSR